MKKYILIFLLPLFLVSCQSSKTLMRKGMYDKAIDKSIKKLKKKPRNQKQILVLEKSYKSAMENDSIRIVFLKKEGRPENWDEIFYMYQAMNKRQDKVRPLPKLRVLDKDYKFVRFVVFNIQNFDDQLIQSKEKAAEYYYAHGKSFLEKGGRENAREAYYDFKKVKGFYADFRDVDELMNKALNLGTSKVLLKVRNNTKTIIPQELEEDLLKINPGGMDEMWIRYFTSKTEGVNYDFFVLLDLKYIDVSPESVKESQFAESREVQDGWQYVLDSKGNVMKDSTGKDIKVPKLKVITCTVVETIQKKNSRITASLDFINASNNSLLKSFPLIAEKKFENFALVPIGDVNALKPETKKRLGGHPVPFPSSADMVNQACYELKALGKDIVKNNERLLK